MFNTIVITIDTVIIILLLLLSPPPPPPSKYIESKTCLKCREASWTLKRHEESPCFPSSSFSFCVPNYPESTGTLPPSRLGPPRFSSWATHTHARTHTLSHSLRIHVCRWTRCPQSLPVCKTSLGLFLHVVVAWGREFRRRKTTGSTSSPLSGGSQRV